MCCGHPIALADCDCPDCCCWTAGQDFFQLDDLPSPVPDGVVPVDLDALETRWQRWKTLRYPGVRVESRTVSTTTRTTDWKAETP